MKLNELGCADATAGERCDATLPDNPQCAPNYHFGMLLGVDDFRAEQGFHLGRARRHQRLLHGAGVVAGYAVGYTAAGYELRVGPGLAVDALGRDLLLEVPQCLSLPLWWLQHRKDEAYADIATPDDVRFDLDVVACYGACLGTPVPAIAEPCAGDSADIAYSRVCETVCLNLVRARTPATLPSTARPPAPGRSFHLLQMWLGLAGPRLDAQTHKPIASDQWLIDRYNAIKALPAVEQADARSTLLREVLARAGAEVAVDPPAHDTADEQAALCLPLARLQGVRIFKGPEGWAATVDDVVLGLRDTLLPTSLLQTLLLAEPPAQPAAAGPVVVAGGASLRGSQLSLVFSQPLAAASVVSAAFAVSEFIPATGWQAYTATVGYDESDPAKPTVQLALDHAPASGTLLRATVFGTGSTPLLGATFIPAGALHPEGDGRTLSTTVHTA